ncbi:hypothetical protein Clacol_006901 [Clathrus columnatus]|uniref:TAFII55 protein conserved region domain-containing protein n=1 Tax=Clathrus columnatus TaxID=1419009 RepID=A0AAV5AG77_9AGAM|nr:hypothetical protein Clacol_006901 [Clathrus columnatus]
MEDEFVDIDGDRDGAGVDDEGGDYIDIEDTMETYEEILQKALEESSQQDIKIESQITMLASPEPEIQSADVQLSNPASTGTTTPSMSLTMTTRRATRQAMTPSALDLLERTTRSSNQTTRPKAQPKLKLKVSERQSSGMSFLGPYDRELDSDDEDLTFEEHFILRMPPGGDCERLRALVEKRDMSKDVWFKFKDSRRGVFHIGDTLYSAKLVDLPCVIESQKTLDNKNVFKVADICQMLVVENKIKNEDEVLGHKTFNIDDFIWQHGITPPLRWVRKRRFRKRANRRTIETVEQEVERLLAQDSLSTKVEYEVLENVNPDLSDSEFMGAEDAMEDMGGDMDGDMHATAADEDEEEEEEEEGDIDEELAAELAREMGEEVEDEEASESEGSDESEEDDDDDDEEVVQAKKLLLEEISDLQAAISRKETEIAAVVNPLIKKRFEDQLKKMMADLEQKQGQREQMIEQQRLRKMGGESGSVATPNIEIEPVEPVEEPVNANNEDENEDEDEDEDADMEELFGM